MTATEEAREIQVDEYMRLIRERDMALRQRDLARSVAAKLWDENESLQATIRDWELTR